MKKAFEIYRGLAAVIVTLAIVGVAAGLWLAPDRLENSWRALVRRPRVAPDEAAKLEARRTKLDAQEREFEESRARRETELRRLELMARSTLARAQAERERAERETRLVALAQPAKEQQEFESNVDLLSRVNSATSLAMMRGWDDTTVMSHLRAMRPGRAAEIVDAMRGDPGWQERLPRILPPENKP